MSNQHFYPCQRHSMQQTVLCTRLRCRGFAFRGRHSGLDKVGLCCRTSGKNRNRKLSGSGQFRMQVRIVKHVVAEILAIPRRFSRGCLKIPAAKTGRPIS
jgi:hypothetical protein